jgi:hypothetical protein
MQIQHNVKLIAITAVLVLCYFNLLAKELDPELSTTEQLILERFTANHLSIQHFAPTVVASNKFRLNNIDGRFVLWDVSSADIYSDRQHNVGLFVLNENSSGQGGNSGIELTGLPLVFSETENHFSQLRGSVNLIKVINSTMLYHVNIFSTLSGSGVISSATDLVVSVGAPKFEPIVLFDLGQTGYFSKTGILTRTYENTRIRLGSRHENLDSLLIETGIKSEMTSKCIVLKVTPGIEECKTKDVKSVDETFLNRAFERFFQSANVPNL